MVEIQDCRKITNHYRGIYRIYPNLIKENWRMSTCNWSDLQTLGSQLIMPKTLKRLDWASTKRIWQPFFCQIASKRLDWIPIKVRLHFASNIHSKTRLTLHQRKTWQLYQTTSFRETYMNPHKKNVAILPGKIPSERLTWIYTQKKSDNLYQATYLHKDLVESTKKNKMWQPSPCNIPSEGLD